MVSNNKVIVIGLDGATWDFITPWVEEGELPNFNELICNGISGDLISSTPPTTFPAWKCYSTGKRAENLGVYHFLSADWKRKKLIINNSFSFKSKEIWDYLSEAGLRVAVLNMPTTSPVKRVNGYMVGGFLSSNRNLTYPSNFREELTKYNYKVHMSYPDFENVYVGIQNARNMIRSKFKLAKDLLKKENLDFLHLTIFITDTIQHLFWKSLQTLEIWKFIDENLGYFIQENYDVFIISDHGFQKTETAFNLGTWLEKENYIKTKFTLGDLLYRMGLNRNSSHKILKKMHLIDFVEHFFSRSLAIKLARKLPEKRGGIDREGIEGVINWDKSIFILLGHLLFMNPLYRSNTSYLNNLILKLQNIKNPKNGEKVFEKIYRKEEIFNKGKYFESAPELIVFPAKGYWITPFLKRKKLFNYEDNLWKGDHKKEGIFLAYGPNFKKGESINNAEIIDLTPTILHMFDVPIPRDIDGKILKEIYNKNSKFAREDK